MIPDEEKVKILSHNYITRLQNRWLSDENKDLFLECLSSNKNLWSSKMLGHAIIVLNSYFSDKISLFDDKINQSFTKLCENRDEFDICTLALMVEFAKKRSSEFSSLVNQVFIDKFNAEKNWNVFSFPELVIINRAINEDTSIYDGVLGNFKQFLDRIIFYTEHTFRENLSLIEEIVLTSRLVHTETLQHYHNLIATKLYENITAVKMKRSLDDNLIYLKILKTLIVPKEIKVLLSKILISLSSHFLLKLNKRLPISGFENMICKRLCNLMIHLRLLYPELMISIYTLIKTKETEKKSKKYFGPILEVFAYFNILELQNYIRIDKSVNLSRIIKDMIEEETTICKSIIENNANPFNDLKYIISFLWSCCVFNHYSSIDFKLFTNYLNENNSSVSAETFNSCIQIRNWIKFELNLDYEFKVKNVYSRPNITILKSNDLLLLEEFKQETSRRISEGFIMDSKVEMMEVDFLYPEFKIAVFLESYRNTSFYGPLSIPLGNKVISDRIFKKLGYSVENLTALDLLCSDKYFLSKK